MPQSSCLRTTAATSSRSFDESVSLPWGLPSARAKIISRSSGDRGKAPACVVRIRSRAMRTAGLIGGDVVLLDDRRPTRVIAPHQGVQLLGGGRRRVHALLLEVGLDFRKRKDGAELG